MPGPGWMVPINNLDQEQDSVCRRIVQRTNGNELIKGFAGTGKTILLLHAMTLIKAQHPRYSVCVVVFTHSLISLLRSGIPLHLHDIPVMTYHKFIDEDRIYDVIIVDEIQDIPHDVVNVLKYNARIKLIAACDYDQSIFEDGVESSQLTNILHPNEYQLPGIWRLPPKIRTLAETLIPNTVNVVSSCKRIEDVVVYLVKSEQIKPRENTREKEYRWVFKKACDEMEIGRPVAIIFPKHARIQMFFKMICDQIGVECPKFVYEPTRKRYNYQPINDLLAAMHVGMRYLGNDIGNYDDAEMIPMVFVMTYESAKGLDFNTVFLPGLNEWQKIWEDDPLDEMSRKLLFVAMTRSRLNLFISYCDDKPHPLIEKMPQELFEKITI